MAQGEKLTGPRPHILGVPYEIRLTIYSYILDDIQHDKRQWERNATSTYDGLLLACRKLSYEASQHVFSTRITSHQILKLANLSANRLTFFSLRSLSIEVDLELDNGDAASLAKALDFVQLSLQELHLLFIGQDPHGNEVAASGCANQAVCQTSSDKPLLVESGQDTEKKLNILRSLVGCRNLRILRIENANLPLLPAMFMINKPFLQAFSATCDSRSITHRYTRWKNKRHVLKGLLVKIDPRNVPPIRALHVDANAAVPAEDIVQCLRATLHHLSWRIPNADFQGPPSQDNDFYGMTDTILKLFWSSDRAPNLETLRLCCGMRDILSSNPRYQWEMGHLVAALSFDLPRFQKLKHFEIHYSGGDNFLRNQLIESLPHGLQRLYISDVTITIQQLVSQVRERYFLSAQHTGPRMPVLPPNLMVDDGYDDVSGKPKIDSMPLHELPTADSIKISGRDQVQYLIAANTSPSDYDTNIFVKRSQCAQHDYLDDYAMRGESKFRRDEIPLNTGKLGFVTFEYDDLEWRLDGPVCVSDYVEESDRTRIFRLNGQLLDREHNLHLANDQATKEEYGIKPRQLGPGVDKEYHGNDVLSETDTYSRHPTIYAAIYNNAELAPKPHVIEQSLKELVACPQLGGNKEECDSMAWYFGNEAEAVKVFEQEPVAKAENQKQKPMLAEVEVRPSTRCRWMCPDFEIPPVGSFPVPTPPSDWKDLVRARWY